METKTLTFDFTYLRDKKKSTMNELKGVRSSHPAEYTCYSVEYYYDYNNIPIPSMDTYFDLIKNALHQTLLNSSRYIHILNKDPIYKITYCVHNEPKEYFMGCYFGKETGNIYFSNVGNDIVFSNIKDFDSSLDIKSVIKAMQQFKVTQDIDRLNNTIIESSGTKINSDSPYLSIFSISNTINSFANKSDDYKLLFDYFRYLAELSVEYRPFLQSFRLVTLMVSHGVGRISKISDDMEELIHDVNKTIIPQNPSIFLYQISGDNVNMDKIVKWLACTSSEYIAPDLHYNVSYVKRNNDLIKELLLKSVIDNSIDDDATMYSDSFMDKISGSLGVSSLELKKTIRQLRANISIGSIYTFGKTNHGIISVNGYSTISHLMFMFDKMSFKYIQRVHSILGRI